MDPRRLTLDILSALEKEDFDVLVQGLAEEEKRNRSPDPINSVLRKQLYNAIKLDHSRGVQKLLDNKASVNSWYHDEMESYSYMTAIMLAARYGSVEVVNILLAANASITADSVGAKEMRVLCWAVASGNVDKVKILLDAKADINGSYEYSEDVTLIDKIDVNKVLKERNQYYRNTKSPLLAATKKGDAPMVELLLERKASVFTYDGHGLTPLHHWTMNSNSYKSKITGLLIDHKADVNKPGLGEYSKETPLHKAVQHVGDNNATLDNVRTLIKCKAKVDSRSVLGLTPLMSAALTGSVSIVRLLLESKADKTLTAHHYNENALDLVETFGNNPTKQLVDLLALSWREGFLHKRKTRLGLLERSRDYSMRTEKEFQSLIDYQENKKNKQNRPK